MPTLPTPEELEEVEDFLRTEKLLDGPCPLWVRSAYPGELQATWAILDDLRIQSGSLRFRCRQDRSDPSISVIFRDRPIWRLDMVEQTNCKPNPMGAFGLGLSARVCGPHYHAWPDNRLYIERHGFGRLPFRRELPRQIRRLNQALAALASEINLTLDGSQRDFDVPPATDLFGMH